MNKSERAFATRAVHAGERILTLDGRCTPAATPIHPSVSYVYPTAAELDAVLGAKEPGYVYHRYGNPTVAALEVAVADLEAGQSAHAFASGMGALHAALLAAGVRAGTAVVAAVDLYGATYSLLVQLFAELGVAVHLVDITDLEAVNDTLEAAQPVTLIAETISNPLLKLADLPALAELSHRHDALLLIDNTFASPYLCNPLALGADMVIHSTTKYLAGHGDVMGGMVVTSPENRRRLYEINKLVGGVLGPFEAWLTLRGLKTLPLRMPRHCDGALQVAQWLAADPRIAQVHYPGLPDQPQFELASRLFDGLGYGGVLSFEMQGADKDTAFRFLEALALCLPATSLGDIYTLVLHPATASHRGLSPARRAEVGIDDGLLRLSVGIEEPSDIIADLDQALDKALGH